MTATAERRGLLRRARGLSPDQILLRKYKLTPAQRAEMVARGSALTQVAGPVGSAVYFLATQRRYGFQDPHGGWLSFCLKDSWDRLPVHAGNVLHQHWFAGQAAPGWWVTARHDTRHVLIGALVTLLVGSVTIGMARKPRKRVANWAIPVRFTLAVPVALLTAAVPIFLFAYVFPEVMHIGFGGSGWLGEWIGKGSWQLTLIGIIAGLGAKRILAPAQDTLQLISIEKHVSDGDAPRWWWKVVYSASYRNRYRYLTEKGHEPQAHGKAMGLFMALGAPVGAFLLGFGIWLLYFGPAAGAGH